MRLTLLLILPLLSFAAPAAAQEPKCPQQGEPIPALLRGWSTPAALEAGTDIATAARAPLTPGKAYALRLAPMASLHYPSQPGRKPWDGYGGRTSLAVPKAGRYRVALGSGAWIDVASTGQPLRPAAHGHGPACSGIRKIIDFDLAPGRYTVTIAGMRRCQS